MCLLVWNSTPFRTRAVTLCVVPIGYTGWRWGTTRSVHFTCRPSVIMCPSLLLLWVESWNLTTFPRRSPNGTFSSNQAFLYRSIVPNIWTSTRILWIANTSLVALVPVATSPCTSAPSSSAPRRLILLTGLLFRSPGKVWGRGRGAWLRVSIWYPTCVPVGGVSLNSNNNKDDNDNSNNSGYRNHDGGGCYHGNDGRKGYAEDETEVTGTVRVKKTVTVKVVITNFQLKKKQTNKHWGQRKNNMNSRTEQYK